MGLPVVNFIEKFRRGQVWTLGMITAVKALSRAGAMDPHPTLTGLGGGLVLHVW